MINKDNYTYVGEELDIFAKANNWKKYIAKIIDPYMGCQVLEVGAGIGSNTFTLCTQKQNQWLCLEPDSKLMARLQSRMSKNKKFNNIVTQIGTIDSIDTKIKFDTILYIDVLEHIHDDKTELEKVGKNLNSKGKVIVLAPAHDWLFTPFDKAVGHYRRYSKRSLAAISPSELQLKKLHYLDSVGLLASTGNLVFLRQKSPNSTQIHFWDNYIIPISTKIDKLFQYKIGKSVLGIWEKRT